jgi:protein-S-isoprenylcysteine O-methyltransferase Ste14
MNRDLHTHSASTGRTPRDGAWVAAQSVLMSVLIASGPWHPGDWHSPAGLILGGLLFVAAGAVGIAGVVHLGHNRTPFPSPRPGSVLIRHGVYAWCRHPLYTSVLLAGASWALLWQSSWTLVLAVLQFPFFLAKSRAEERLLRRAFLGYEDYARQVKRFLPGVF